MNVTEFVNQMKTDLDEFEKHWKENQISNPQDYPAETDDWEDQFMSFLEMMEIDN